VTQHQIAGVLQFSPRNERQLHQSPCIYGYRGPAPSNKRFDQKGETAEAITHALPCVRVTGRLSLDRSRHVGECDGK